MPPKRKYNEDYIQFEFTSVDKNGTEMPLCDLSPSPQRTQHEVASPGQPPRTGTKG